MDREVVQSRSRRHTSFLHGHRNGRRNDRARKTVRVWMIVDMGKGARIGQSRRWGKLNVVVGLCMAETN